MIARCCPNCGTLIERMETAKVGDLSINFYGDAWWKGKRLLLTAAEGALVYTLASSPGLVFTAEAIYNAIGSSAADEHMVIGVTICRTRFKFVSIDRSFDRIETVRGRGWRWRV